MGMMAWEGKEAELLEVREPERYVHHTLLKEGERETAFTSSVL